MVLTWLMEMQVRSWRDVLKVITQALYRRIGGNGAIPVSFASLQQVGCTYVVSFQRSILIRLRLFGVSPP